MKIKRRYTAAGRSPYEGIAFTTRSSVIRNTDGSTDFELLEFDLPEGWSQVATDILAQKYFRKAGVPQMDAQGNAVVVQHRPALRQRTDRPPRAVPGSRLRLPGANALRS